MSVKLVWVCSVNCWKLTIVKEILEVEIVHVSNLELAEGILNRSSRKRLNL